MRKAMTKCQEVTQSRPEIGTLFYVGGALLKDGTDPRTVRLSEGVEAFSEIDWIARAYEKEVAYIVAGVDKHAGLLFGIGLKTQEFVIVPLIPDAHRATSSELCGEDAAWPGSRLIPWSATASRFIVDSVPTADGRIRYCHRYIHHQDFVGRREGEECDLAAGDFGYMETFDEAWHECVESARHAFMDMSLYSSITST